MNSRNTRDVLAVAVLIAATALSHPPSASACPCPENPDPQTSLAQSTAVFLGRVVNIDESGGLSPSTGTRMRRVDFRVDKAWKGIERIPITVTTEADSAACGYGFSTGSEYLVYAHGEKGELQVSLCSRTRALVGVSSEELAALGEPTFLPEYEDFPLFILVQDHPIASVSALAVLAALAITHLFRKLKAARQP